MCKRRTVSELTLQNLLNEALSPHDLTRSELVAIFTFIILYLHLYYIIFTFTFFNKKNNILLMK